MISEALYKLGLIIVVLIANTLIAYTCASVVMYFALVSGWDKTLSLVVSVAVAILVYAYIRFNHLILVRFQMEKENK